MRGAGQRVEGAVLCDGADGAGGDAQLAVDARVVVQRLPVLAHLRVHQDGHEQDEAAELRVDDVAVQAHHTEPGGRRDRLVCHHPDPLAGEAVHLLGEADGRIECAASGVLEGLGDAAGGMVGLLVGLVELLVGHAAGGGAAVVAVHPDRHRDQGAGAGQRGLYVLALTGQVGVVQADRGDVVRPGRQAQLAQPGRVDHRRRARDVTGRAPGEYGLNRRVGRQLRRKPGRSGLPLGVTRGSHPCSWGCGYGSRRHG